MSKLATVRFERKKLGDYVALDASGGYMEPRPPGGPYVPASVAEGLAAAIREELDELAKDRQMAGSHTLRGPITDRIIRLEDALAAAGRRAGEGVTT